MLHYLCPTPRLPYWANIAGLDQERPKQAQSLPDVELNWNVYSICLTSYVLWNPVIIYNNNEGTKYFLLHFTTGELFVLRRPGTLSWNNSYSFLLVQIQLNNVLGVLRTFHNHSLLKVQSIVRKFSEDLECSLVMKFTAEGDVSTPPKTKITNLV